jgi:hypothetical protein
MFSSSFWSSLDPGSGIRDGIKIGSGINVADPQHWSSVHALLLLNAVQSAKLLRGFLNIISGSLAGLKKLFLFQNGCYRASEESYNILKGML